MRGLAVVLHAASVRRGEKWALRKVSWQLNPGERWALLGDNGSGKTQLLKLLSGDVWPTPGREAKTAARSYLLGHHPVDLIEAKRRLAYVGAEQQDKYARYGWNLRVREVVATGLHRTDLLLKPVTARQAEHVAAKLRGCGISRLAARRFLSLSYGQKRLVLLARALVQDPDWLLLDEFYNGLDTHFRRRLDSLLGAARKGGQSWVASAHRAGDVPRGTNRMLELRGGRVRAVKPMLRPQLLNLVRRAGENLPAPRRTPRIAADAPVLVRLCNVKLYVEYRLVLRNLDWQLRRGEHWAVFGANGAGKSSFLKLLYGDLAPAVGGLIERSGFPKGASIAQWKRQTGFVSPELHGDYGVDVSVADLVASGRYASIGLVDEATSADRRAAAYWLRFFGLLSVAKRRPRELSYGQMRRALLARAMTADARLLLLDEPLTGLDPTQRAIMKRLLERVMGRLTLVIAVHHPEDLPRGMTHALRLHNRRAIVINS
jgi:molybdate transport system ATP-binding protein